MSPGPTAASPELLFPVRTGTPEGLVVPKPVVCSPRIEQTHCGYCDPSGQGWENGNVPCSLLFQFTEGAVAGSQASHGAVCAVAVALATVTFSGYGVCVEGVCVVSTTGQPYGLIHQLLEGAYFLGVGSDWVLIHQILRSSGKGGLGHTVLKLLFRLVKMRL